MIYYGMRSSKKYLERVGDVRSSLSAHHLCSVVGGLTFIHALNSKTASITLIDSDPEAFEHCRLILKLIEICVDLKDFLSVLSCRQIIEASPFLAQATFGEYVQHSSRMRDLLDKDLLDLYLGSYGSIKLNEDGASFSIDDSKVLFFGFDLTPLTFNWQFGQGNLADNEHFLILKSILSRVPVKYVQATFESINYRELFRHRDAPIVFLISNCDGPLFTQCDVILRSIEATCPVSFRYISWIRDMNVTLPEVESETLTKLLSPFAKGKVMHVVRQPGSSYGEYLDKLEASELREFSDFSELKSKQIYGGALLLFESDTADLNEIEVHLAEMLGTCWPSFKKVALVSRAAPPSKIFGFMEQMEFQRSYRLVMTEWLAKGCVMVWELRGAD